MKAVLIKRIRYINNDLASKVAKKSKLLHIFKLNCKMYVVSRDAADHSNSSKNATKTIKNLIFWTTKRVKIIITPIVSKKASTTRLDELAAPRTYIPKAKPKSQSNLTGIVKIVIITEKVNNMSLLSDCNENV